MTRSKGPTGPGKGASGLVLALLATWPLATRYPDGPPPAHTGGFGEPTCEECHQGGSDASATVLIRGLPARFEPGRSYDLEVSAAREALARAGFELAVRVARGEDTGRDAGRLEPLDPQRVALVRDTTTGVTYARHTRAGTRPPRPGEVRWPVRWTAPGRRDAVVFHAAVVAANDDESNFGDDVYARAQVVAPEQQ